MRPKRHKPGEEMEPVEVFGRIKSINEYDERCLKTTDDKIECTADHSDKGLAAQFTHVFDETCDQVQIYESVARPMVSALLNGKHGLLFNYGVTSSGKTYTMTGSPSAPGFLPRSLETIFASIDGQQTKHFQVQAAEANGFHLLDEADVMDERVERRHEVSRIQDNIADYDITEHYLEEVPDGVKFAVFMSYIDIYNEAIYDLLESTKITKQTGKRLRDHRTKGVYADGIKVVEVRSIEDAYQVYEKGLKRRRQAETTLNMNSSRSHSILTVTVVRVPYDDETDCVYETERDLTKYASSLHFVDLAGSERQNRTKAAGSRLKEAGNINNSLMTLRRCLDALRRNQRNGTDEPVPYRSSKITHIFRQFFEVLGGVKLVICLNPALAEFDENLNVLKFAEDARAIEVVRKVEVKPDLVKLKEVEKKSRRRTVFEPWGVNEEALSLGPRIPDFELFDVNDLDSIPNFIDCLKQRQEKREIQEEECTRLSRTFRKKLAHYEREGTQALSKLQIMEPQLDRLETELTKGQAETRKMEKKNRALMETQRVYELDRKELQGELQSKNVELKQTERSKRKAETDARQKIEDEKRRLMADTERQIKDTRSRAQRDLMSKEEKLNRIRGILDSKRKQAQSAGSPFKQQVSSSALRSRRRRSKSESEASTPQQRERPKMPQKPARSRDTTPTRTPRSREPSPRVRNSGQKPIPTTDQMQRPREKSDGKKWLAHTPNDHIRTNTVLQPAIVANKRVHMPVESDLKKADKYLLTHQEQTTGNQLKTTLVKGEIFDTQTGGIQVKFTGKERLTTGTAGTKSVGTKRRSAELNQHFETDEPESIESAFTDVNVRCGLAVEHHRGAASAHVTNSKMRRK